MTGHFLLRNMSTNESIPLIADSITLGRKRDCEIVVDSTEASRRHARIRVAGDRLTIEDLESTNGTLVNRRRLRQPEQLRAGDIIAIGQQHFMVVAPDSDSHLTLLGGRLAPADANYVLDQDDPSATGMRMPFPMPPGWTAEDVALVGKPAAREPLDILAEEMTRQSIAGDHTDGVLMVVSDQGRNTLFPLKAGQSAWVIGRSAGSDVAIDEATISSRHALISRDTGQWFVADSNSTNGTRLNGKPVARAALEDGDELRLGKVRLLFMSIQHAAAPG
ncbi:FHA domain-containing protein [Seongchinamella sediminis]|uniref:FHA domain-containing protein n=1 Tax=Seongchinamella sediminis TaxID=2283635 RepID=A0A3L7DVV2_9GAMM|nr:FHA domain-containing protein [Seongchinamella sediminis]RLQ20669.1 FHA domain-containing protein [Seongchinamella sediminis]